MVLDPARTWSVLASMRDAIYIESDAEELLWLAANSSALHSRAILLPVMPAEMSSVGTECCLEDECLLVGANPVISLRDAELWSPNPLVRDGVSASKAARLMSTAIEQAALRSHPESLLASVLLPPVQRSGERDSRNAFEQGLFATATRAVKPLCQVSTGDELLERLHDALGLVGFGQGLTPSGDDLLGAFLYTLYVLDSPCRETCRSTPVCRAGADLDRGDDWWERVHRCRAGNLLQVASAARDRRGIAVRRSCDAAAPTAGTGIIYLPLLAQHDPVCADAGRSVGLGRRAALRCAGGFGPSVFWRRVGQVRFQCR